MFQIDSFSRIPVYEQIINQLEHFILTGILEADNQIPSVRNLSVSLSINPNTIQRAYTELEEAGLIYTQRGIGKFVVDDKEKLKELQIDMLKDVVDNFIKESKELGVNKEEIINILNERYN